MASVLMTKHMPRAKNMPGQRDNKGLHLEEMDDGAHDGAQRHAEEQHRRNHDRRAEPQLFQHVGRKDRGKGNHRPDGEIDAARKDDKGHPDRGDQQKCIVDQEVEEDLWRRKAPVLNDAKDVETDK